MTETNFAGIYQHLSELKRRFLFVIITLFSFFLVFFYYSDSLLIFLLQPLNQALKGQQPLVTTQVTALVFVPLQIAFDAACLCTIPLLFFQLWRFVAPGLYPKERSLTRYALLLSISLFIAGLLFCFYAVLPLLFTMLIRFTPQQITFLPDITHATHFIVHFLLLFGLCFQIPLVNWLLVRFNYLSVTTLRTLRPYIIVSAFIIGMLLTPPDVLSQLILAIPLCFLYELGILLARRGSKA